MHHGSGAAHAQPSGALPANDLSTTDVQVGDLDGDGWPDVAIAVAEPATGTAAMANILLLTRP